MKKKMILCIDDIRTNLLIIENVIEDIGGGRFDTLFALSAKEGLDILHTHKIDIILLDIMMPEIDGFECAKMIKSDAKIQHIPIIFVTANKDDTTIEQCFKVGGEDYINKPFNHTELLARISFHLKSTEQDLLLTKEKEYVQSILDLQDNLIFVTNGRDDLNVNKAFLNFFHVPTIEEFQKKYSNIADNFLEEEGYFHLGLVEVGKTWVDEVIERSKDEDVLIKIKLFAKEYIFNLKATYFSDQYIVTLTDVTQLSQLSLEYKREASYDTLTQVYNRNMFHRLIDIKMMQAKEKKKSFVFIILDIDYFKKVNDTFGHLVGDEILIHLSKLIQSQVRDNDLFARWGGEEFVLAFDVSLSKGIEIANNIRRTIAKTQFSTVDTISCSFGLTDYREKDTLDTMILRADKALYEAKASGRNKVCHQ